MLESTMFGTEGNSVEANNIVEIRTMTPEQVVQEWASANKITADAVDKFSEDGFTSIEAVKLIDAEDLAKSKITRGQKKLILTCVKALKGERKGRWERSTSSAGTSADKRGTPIKCGQRDTCALFDRPINASDNPRWRRPVRQRSIRSRIVQWTS